MKKLLLIIMLFMFSVQVHAQGNTDKATTALKAPYSGDNVLYHSYQKTLEAIRMIIVSGGASDTTLRKVLDSLAVTNARLVSIRGNQTNGSQTTQITSSSNSYGTSFTTTGTTIDSVAFGFTTRSVTFINDGISTDTLFISSVKTFPSTNRIERMGGEGLTKQWAVSKLYFKVGTTPVASKKIRVEAQ